MVDRRLCWPATQGEHRVDSLFGVQGQFAGIGLAPESAFEAETPVEAHQPNDGWANGVTPPIVHHLQMLDVAMLGFYYGP